MYGTPRSNWQYLDDALQQQPEKARCLLLSRARHLSELHTPAHGRHGAAGRPGHPQSPGAGAFVGKTTLQQSD